MDDIKYFLIILFLLLFESCASSKRHDTNDETNAGISSNHDLVYLPVASDDSTGYKNVNNFSKEQFAAKPPLVSSKEYYSAGEELSLGLLGAILGKSAIAVGIQGSADYDISRGTINADQEFGIKFMLGLGISTYNTDVKAGITFAKTFGALISSGTIDNGPIFLSSY